MAPLFHYLHCLLFLSFLFVPSFFVYAHTNTQISPTPTTHILFARRILSSKSLYYLDDDQDLTLPKRKKKDTISSFDGVNESKIKKKKLSLDDDDEKELKSIPKRKKKSFDDDDEKQSKSLLKNKKDDVEIGTTKVVTSKISTPNNQTKPIKPKITSSDSNSSTKTQAKTSKPILDSSSSNNKTKLTKPATSSSKSKHIGIDSNKSKIKKSNSTSISTNKSSTLGLSKTTSSTKNNKTKSSESNKKPITTTEITKSNSKTTKNQQHNPPPSPPSSWVYQDNEDDNDLISDFRELPTKFQQTFIPDMQRISTTSRVYLSKASKEMTKGFKPYVGTKYAASMTTAISFAFVLIPLLLVSLVFNQIKAYFNLQRLLIFIQIYLSIYFSILCVSSLITGLEPLRFFYATSRSTYIWLHLLQTLGYVMFLLLLLMYLVLVFSTNESGLGLKVLGLVQTLVGFAVGLHYYMTVFHTLVLRQPPKTNWKVHGIYAASFFIISLFARMDTRKKAYLEEGGQQGKLN